MIRPLAALLLALAPGIAQAQFRDTSVTQVPTDRAGGVVLRGLDRTTGDVRDMELRQGETQALGNLQVTLGECRYPQNNPSGNAFAYLVIREAGVEQPAFTGWMIAASPALSALEHRRYDVWVMRCNS
ncbi:DUF2155 domain-containing protein [Maribius pontilimi]|uniref:DUF2155 domain-containing protein n=1 Tax=Palleronia pontilimi TaxID=1964209 RepID=A0A934I987_9RHOB|nr:DUF2155 domain-containing protein [Palleronia pontilimi]MBJ3762819.1 DUF2155 domain-containing protein [Palleronia pontilimi]